jgi:hypothetical protein
MRERLGLAAWQSYLVAAGIGAMTTACTLPDDNPPTQRATPDAGPPTPCTASASTTPFCTSATGTCPLLADDTIACPANPPVSQGFAPSGSVGLASGPGHRGDLVFATASGTYNAQQEYVELGAFDPAGTATFVVDTFPPIPYEDTGSEARAGLFAVTSPQGAPILLSTIGGALSAAVGTAASGGTFTVESALPAPGAGEGWLIAGAVVEPNGAIDALVQSSQTSEVARRDPTGTWTNRALPSYAFGSAAIAVDASGVVYTAGWVAASTAGMMQLEISAGSKAPVALATLAEMDVTTVELTVGRNSDGSPLPVAAFGSTLTLAVPDGKGGFTTIQPTLAVAQPYKDDCAGSLSLGNCSCPSTCSQTGDTAAWVQLVRDAQGNVYVAWLEVDTNMTYPVMLNSTSVGSQKITCSCDPALQNGTGTTTGVGLQLERLVTTPSASTEHRGTIPVPAETTGSAQAVDGNGTIQLLLAATGSTGAATMRRVVLDASKLP